MSKLKLLGGPAADLSSEPEEPDKLLGQYKDTKQSHCEIYMMKMSIKYNQKVSFSSRLYTMKVSSPCTCSSYSRDTTITQLVQHTLSEYGRLFIFMMQFKLSCSLLAF